MHILFYSTQIQVSYEGEARYPDAPAQGGNGGYKY